jgi:hypothetical protein
MAKKKATDKPAAAKAPAPAPPALTPEEEASALEARVAADQARVQQLRNPAVEFPKYVKGHVFNSRAEQDAAGPEFADEAE